MITTPHPPCHMFNSPCPFFFFLTEIWPFLTTWRWCLLWHWHQVHPVHFDIILTHVLTLHYFLLFRTHTTLLNFRWWRKGVLLCTLLFVLMWREPCRLKSDNPAIKSHSTHSCLSNVSSEVLNLAFSKDFVLKKPISPKAYNNSDGGRF